MEPISTALSALNSSYTLLKAALGVKVSHEISMALQDLLSKVTDARLAGADMAERIVAMQTELESARSESRQLRERIADRQNYKMQTVLSPAVVAYVYRSTEPGDETPPPHALRCLLE